MTCFCCVYAVIYCRWRNFLLIFRFSKIFIREKFRRKTCLLPRFEPKMSPGKPKLSPRDPKPVVLVTIQNVRLVSKEGTGTRLQIIQNKKILIVDHEKLMGGLKENFTSKFYCGGSCPLHTLYT